MTQRRLAEMFCPLRVARQQRCSGGAVVKRGVVAAAVYHGLEGRHGFAIAAQQHQAVGPAGCRRQVNRIARQQAAIDILHVLPALLQRQHGRLAKQDLAGLRRPVIGGEILLVPPQAI